MGKSHLSKTTAIIGALKASLGYLLQGIVLFGTDEPVRSQPVHGHLARATK
jgi:hypothetical protein